ncbi:glycosyl transferase [candidate division KSB3 bacterium]|uniref:Glycosyl transferase n=1 Tax=candidate division KSB3 bacterium TaxID=2044937 RepID=A0A2G6K8N4_9BACT|nr:MAG: glycosyl transferase [candidate division KSB3 bacterium]
MVQNIRSQCQPSFRQYAAVPFELPASCYHTPLLPEISLPVVSVVTPSLNQAAFLERTISSVCGQNYPKLEYVIQDGGSIDGTCHILERYRHALTHVESYRDNGQAHAINLGFRHATGDIMAWLNADDMLLPGAIAYISRFFGQHPDVDVVYGYRICLDEHDDEIGRWVIAPAAESVLPWANYIPQETLFWRRRIWDRVGKQLDESFQFAMDWDLLLRFREVGARFACLPRFLGAFRVHNAQKTHVWDDVGRREAARLHVRCHGRAVEWLEVRYQVRRYLIRTAWYMLRQRLKIRQYS